MPQLRSAVSLGLDDVLRNCSCWARTIHSFCFDLARVGRYMRVLDESCSDERGWVRIMFRVSADFFQLKCFSRMDGCVFTPFCCEFWPENILRN